MDNSEEFQVMLDEAIRVEPDAFRDFDRTKNVQDQLQEMIGDFQVIRNAMDTLYLSENFDRDYWLSFDSYEQLWLAFVMKEKYGKAWNGEEWIKA